MKGNRLYKFEKLCSRNAINALFSGGRGVVAYPLRAVVNLKNGDGRVVGSCARFMITVPKKRIRTAVGRVLLRRRIREAYRLNRQLLLPQLAASICEAEIAFIYMDKEIADYATIDASMKKLLVKIAAQAADRQSSSLAGKESTENVGG